MNRGIIFSAILALAAATGCSDSGSDGTSAAFVDPSGGAGFVTKTVNTKRYTINAESCGPATTCSAAVFSHGIGDTQYSGFVAADRHEAIASQDFFIKAYWAGSLPTGTSISISGITIIVFKRPNYYTVTNQTCTFDITNNGDGTYDLQFKSGPYNINGYTINTNDRVTGTFH